MYPDIMASILDEIVEQTASDLKKRKKQVSLSDFESFPEYERDRRSLAKALSSDKDVSIIAEIKKASPSKGMIRTDFDPAKIALQYQQGGAAALSVLTNEPAFKGSLEYLQRASREVDIPLLRKDFIIDLYQLAEARAYGADAVLLIATITNGHQLQELHQAANELGLECLVECYSEDDLKFLDFEQVQIFGANNRDLHSFNVDLHRGINLLQAAPDDTVLVSESGLSSPKDLKLLHDEGIHAALIGEFFMRQDDPGLAVKKILDELDDLINKEPK